MIAALGAGVADLKLGERVAYITRRYGVYAEHNMIEARHLVKVPGAISDEQVAAVLLKGLTVYMLINQVHQLKAGDTALVHAAPVALGSCHAMGASERRDRDRHRRFGGQSEDRRDAAAMKLFCTTRKTSSSASRP